MPRTPRLPRNTVRPHVTVESLHRILRILRVATSTLDPKVLFRNVVDAIQREFPRLFHVSIFLAFKGPNVFVPMAMAGESPEIFVDKYPDGYTQNLEMGLLGQAWKTKRTYLSNDVLADTNYHCAVYPVTHSELCVPIRVEDEVVGVMNLESKRRNAFQPEDVEFFEILADQLGNAVHNSIVHDQLKSRGDQVSVLTSAAAAGENTLRDICDSLALPVLKVDSDDRVAFANKAARDLLGAEKTELDGMWFLDLLDAESRGRWEDVRRANPPEKQDLRLTLGLRGRVLHCAWQAFPVHEGEAPLPFLLKRLD